MPWKIMPHIWRAYFGLIESSKSTMFSHEPKNLNFKSVSAKAAEMQEVAGGV